MKIIIYIFLGITFFFAYTKYIEYRGIYYPLKGMEFTPRLIGLGYEDIYLKTEDGLKINAWFIPHETAKYTLLFFHGNAGNIGYRLDKILLLHNLGLNIFIIDYRGYGLSQGRPSEKGLYLDAKAAYGYLVETRRILPEQIMLYGESLGTAVAIDLAALAPVEGLILEGAFSTGKDMARVVYPFIPTFFVSNIFDCVSKMKRVTAASLFLHSRDDEAAPLKLAEKLFRAAHPPKFFVLLAGSHNSAFLDAKEEYLSGIRSFLDSL